MRQIFWGFCRNWFLTSPLHYLSGRSDFGFEFADIFVFEKRLPAITNTGSCWLSVSVILGVTDSPYCWIGESTTPRITYTRSRQLPASPIRRKENSLYRWYGESSTPPLVLRWVAGSLYYWVGESQTPRIGDMGSRYSEKKLVKLRFSVL